MTRPYTKRKTDSPANETVEIAPDPDRAAQIGRKIAKMFFEMRETTTDRLSASQTELAFMLSIAAKLAMDGAE